MHLHCRHNYVVSTNCFLCTNCVLVGLRALAGTALTSLSPGVSAGVFIGLLAAVMSGNCMFSGTCCGWSVKVLMFMRFLLNVLPVGVSTIYDLGS